MCRGTTFPAWQAECIRRLLARGDTEAALLIVNDTPPAAGSRWAKVRRRVARRDLLWALFLRLFVVRAARASRPVDLSAELAEVPVMRCRVTRRGKFSEYFSDPDVERIRARDLDFVLRFEFGIIRGAILDVARHGVWSFHHDDEKEYRGGPPCFWEIYRGDPVTGSMLQRLTERLDAGVVLHKGWFRTIDHSYARNRNQAYLGSADWPARVCGDIRSGVAGYLHAEPVPATAPIYRNPRARQVLAFTAKVVRNFVRNQFRGLLRADQWTVGIARAPIQAFLEPDAPRPAVEWAPEPGGVRYLADPFAVQRDGRVAVLAEDYDYGARRGRISVVERAPDGAFSSPRPAIDTEVHASYPFVFEHDGDLYCAPETFQAREVAVWRATRFPDRWDRVATPVSGFAALDPTLFRHDGRWWLLCTDYDRGPNAKLHAWYTEDLHGPWTPHPSNPVKTDVRSARPAGTPFVHDGMLYRPAQDNAGTYGGAVVINRVTRLSPTEFAEEVVATVRPYAAPYDRGMHTLSSAGDLTVVDGKRQRFIWPAFKRELAARVRRR